MQLPVVMSQRTRVMFRITRNGFHAISNAAGINHMRFLQLCLLALQFGDVYILPERSAFALRVVSLPFRAHLTGSSPVLQCGVTDN